MGRFVNQLTDFCCKAAQASSGLAIQVHIPHQGGIDHYDEPDITRMQALIGCWRLCKHPHQSGIALVEVLVSVLLLSVGVLAVAALQLYSLAANTEAGLHSHASVKVRDIIEQVRLNPHQRAHFTVSAANCQAANLPDGSDFIRRQLAGWCSGVAAVLPGGEGAVRVTEGVVSAEVSWLERHARGEEGPAQRVYYRLSARVANE